MILDRRKWKFWYLFDNNFRIRLYRESYIFSAIVKIRWI